MTPRFVLRLLMLGFAGLFLAGCASSVPASHPGDTQHGYASWYGSENGQRTASGERFDRHKLTAAHRHLPFGTIVRITNQENGKSVEVRINDRGPWSGHSRIIDVSSAAADGLAMKGAGIVPVTVEVLQLGSGRHATAP